MKADDKHHCTNVCVQAHIEKFKTTITFIRRLKKPLNQILVGWFFFLSFNCNYWSGYQPSEHVIAYMLMQMEISVLHIWVDLDMCIGLTVINFDQRIRIFYGLWLAGIYSAFGSCTQIVIIGKPFVQQGFTFKFKINAITLLDCSLCPLLAPLQSNDNDTYRPDERRSFELRTKLETKPIYTERFIFIDISFHPHFIQVLFNPKMFPFRHSTSKVLVYI